jgi:antitoxin CptB
MKELDLVLVRYLEHHWSDSTVDEKGVFERLLELPDPELAAYLLGHEIPPQELAGLVARLRNN